MVELNGWRPWDWRSYTRLSFLRRGCEEARVDVGVLDELEGEFRSDFRWNDLVEFGPQSPDGAVSAVTFSGGFESPWRLEAASSGETLLVRVVPARSTWRRAVLRLKRPGVRRHRWEGPILHAGAWSARALGGEDTLRLHVSWDDPHVVGRPGEALYLAVGMGPAPAVDRAAIDAAIEAALARAERTGLRGAGALADLPEAMARTAQWNAVAHPRLGRRAVVSTREWCREWGGVLLFGWDALFHAALASADDPELGYQSLEATLAPVEELGFVPNWTLSSGAATADRSHPPVGSLCALRVFHANPDPGRLRPIFDALLRWNAWWPGARDRGDGLLSWGSNAEPRWAAPQIRQRPQHAQICACWESGMDNSPLFDGVAFDPGRGTLVDADVGLNALWAADARCLAILARYLGEDEAAERLAARAHSMAERIGAELFDPHRGVYANRGPAGAFSAHLTPTSLYPLLAGGVSRERALAAVRSLLEEEGRLGGSFGLPSVAREDAAYRENDYWRGRSWAPLDFLVYEGLRQGAREHGGELAEPCAALARRSLALFARAWREERGVFENYNACDGRGGDVPNSDRRYTWGGLLAYIGICELLDVEPGGALRLGDPTGRPAAVQGLWILGRQCELDCGPDGMVLRVGGEDALRSEFPARLRIAGGELEVLEGDPGRVELRAERLPRLPGDCA